MESPDPRTAEALKSSPSCRISSQVPSGDTQQSLTSARLEISAQCSVISDIWILDVPEGRRVNPVTLMIWRGQPKTKTSDITPLKGKVGRRESGLLETQKLLLLETERMRYWLSAGKSVTVDRSSIRQVSAQVPDDRARPDVPGSTTS